MVSAVSSDKAHILPFPFEVVLAELPKVSGVDMVSAGDSPVTMRWLTPRNIYVNLGMERLEGEKTKLSANTNSYAVTDEDLQSVASAIEKHMATVKWEVPKRQVKQREVKATKASEAPSAP